MLSTVNGRLCCKKKMRLLHLQNLPEANYCVEEKQDEETDTDFSVKENLDTDCSVEEKQDTDCDVKEKQHTDCDVEKTDKNKNKKN